MRRILERQSAPLSSPSGRGALPAAALAVGALLGASFASAQPGLLFENFQAELNSPSPQYVAVSNHFRHAEVDPSCEASGCVLMGPTDDREACERWIEAYNAVDPYDHARCIELIGEG